jgi:uncharacterized phage-associated protein
METQFTNREKQLNAILYFAERIKFPHKIKIFKLLYYFDFEHLKQTGRSVTGTDYIAWQFGPVPKTLFDELQNESIPDDFRSALALEKSTDDEGRPTVKFIPMRKPDMSLFTPRQKTILENLVFAFKEVVAKTMIDATHEPNRPWGKTLKIKGEGGIIDSTLALEKDGEILSDYVEAFERERTELLKNFPV